MPIPFRFRDLDQPSSQMPLPVFPNCCCPTPLGVDDAGILGFAVAFHCDSCAHTAHVLGVVPYREIVGLLRILLGRLLQLPPDH